MRFTAAIHGVELGGESAEVAPSKPESGSRTLFGDPEEYSHLSAEEKEKLTHDMRGHFKGWASDSPLKSN